MISKIKILVVCLLGATAQAAPLAPNPYGPISYPGISTRITEAGVEAPGFEFNPRSVPKPQNWDAQWRDMIAITSVGESRSESSVTLPG